MANHERDHEPGSQRVGIEELGKAKCCGGRMYATNVLQDGRTQRTRHCEHRLDCKLEYASEPVPQAQKKAKAAKAGR